MLEIMLATIPKKPAGAVGQILFEGNGAWREWIVPEGVFSICAIAVGGGGGYGVGGNKNYGGGGGALAYSNNIAVTPGQLLRIFAAAGGISSNGANGTEGGASAILGSNWSTTYLQATGGAGGALGASAGATFANSVGDVKNPGGVGGNTLVGTGWISGGGGAGGYTGPGGYGRAWNESSKLEPANGSGGGGAGGDAYAGVQQTGGGVGLLGIGDNGLVGGPAALRHGSVNNGATPYGGGGGQNVNGMNGAIRIIWGSDRAFPSTQVLDF